MKFKNFRKWFYGFYKEVVSFYTVSDEEGKVLSNMIYIYFTHFNHSRPALKSKLLPPRTRNLPIKEMILIVFLHIHSVTIRYY